MTPTLCSRLIAFLLVTVTSMPLIPIHALEANEAKLNRLHIVYVTNRDRKPMTGYRERLPRIMLDVQDFYRTEMARNGYGPLTFELDKDKDDTIPVHVATLDWDFDPERKFLPRDIRPVIAPVLAKHGVDIERSYFVAFYNAYWQDGDKWTYDVVYTGVGDPRNGATWVTDHTLLDPRNFDPDLKEHINDRGHRLSVGQFNVKMIGGVAHELGHALGLPHNRERPDEERVLGKALMGAGNYTYRQERIGSQAGSFLTPPHAFILARHPLFTRQAAAAELTTPDVVLERLTFEHAAGMLLVAGRTVPNNDVAGVVCYHDKLPTGINKDYDAWSYLAHMRPDGAFAAGIDLPEPGEYALHVKVYFRNGLYRTFTFNHEITGQAKPGLDALRSDDAWHQAKMAFLRKDTETLRKLSQIGVGATAERKERLARFLKTSEQWQSFARPCDVAEDVKQISLSATRWEDASVGWFVPSFDGVITQDGDWVGPLKSTDGECPRGLYAHAPSRYVYNLGGRWQTLNARIGLQPPQRGSVAFAVRLDGKEVFRSKVIYKEDGDTPVEIDLTGGKMLELIADPGETTFNDWSIWFEPTLSR